ncbi:hypothetical protein BGZ58_009656 [Dissophora ornata]|nr:hypothetical protein BGZ58_009656 [Dissophora ornata]
MLAGIFPSSRASLSSQKTLELFWFHLENARKSKDPEIAFVLCDYAEATLSQMKKVARKSHSSQNPADRSLRDEIAAAYNEHGKVLGSLGHHDLAQASYKRAKKWGYVQDVDRQPNSSRPISITSSIFRIIQPPAVTQGIPETDILLTTQDIFDLDATLPVAKYNLPEADERITSTPHLAYCLGLLPSPSLSSKAFDDAERAWSQAKAKDPDEQERLRTLATDLVAEFIKDELKQETTVAEVLCLAPVIEQAHFRRLLMTFVNSIEQSVLLEVHLLEGLAQLINSAGPGYLEADDLVKILQLLSMRLQDTHWQSTGHLYRLTLTISAVLDAMADSQVKGLKREQLHEPLSAYLGMLRDSTDAYLVYQAAYAFQALQYVPNDESPLQATLRRAGIVVKGISGVVSAVKGLDLNGFIEGLEHIQKGLPMTEVFQLLKNAYEGVSALGESGQSLLDCIKEAFNRQAAWYPALRGIDALLQAGQLAKFKKLTCEAPCRNDPAFQWGLCQRLGDVAHSPLWDTNTRQNAVAFLGYLYKNDAVWGQHASVKQWVLKILMQLKGSMESTIKEHACTIIQELERSGDATKRALCQACLKEGASSYPLGVALPPLASSLLLDRVLNKPKVEADLRKLKQQRLKEQGEAVYISPQAKPNLQSPDDTLFDLTEKVKDFLSSDRKVLLLLGDSGAGKSTFNRALEKHLWQTYEKKHGRIPLFINLPAIDKPEQDLIAKQLRMVGFTEPQIRELKDHREFVVICDGYDESQQTRNLYVSNRLNHPGEWRAQMIVSCRSEYVGHDYQDRFQPTDRNHNATSGLFQEAVVAPFSMAQVQDYIKQYVSMSRPLWQTKDYKQALDQIPHMQALVKNPFLLTLALEVLPHLVDPGQDFASTHITRVALYDQFVTQWLERGKKRLVDRNLSGPEKSAFEALTKEGFTQNGIAFLKDFAAAIYEQQSGNPVVEYRRFIDEGTWKDAFFGRDHEKQLLLEASPLICSGNQYRFIHKSLLECCVARAVFESREDRRNGGLASTLHRRGSMSSVLSFERQDVYQEEATTVKQPVLESPLARINLVGEPSILQFLEERVQQDAFFKQQLLAVIERSKTERMARKAAANAITILVRAGVQFNGADLQGIQIPGADLSYGVFDSVQLQGADLRKVILRGIWLRQANLSGAQMTGVQFGEWPFLREESEVNPCVYSPCGETCAVGLYDGGISMYTTSTWEKIWTLSGHCGEIRSIVYSPKGDQIASGGDDMTVRLWDVETGACRYTLSGHKDWIWSVAYSPKGNQIASGSSDKTVRLWDVETGTCRHTLSGHSNWVQSVVFSPNGDQIASCGDDKTVRLWDAETGACRHTLTGHSDWIRSVVYSPKGDQIASCSSDKTVRLWDIETGACRHILGGHSNWVQSVVFSRKGDEIASGSRDKTLRLWDVATGACRHILSGHSAWVQSVVYSPKGDQIASGSVDRTVRLWDVETGACSHTISGHSNSVNCVAYSPKGNQIASGSSDKSVGLWEVDTGASRYITGGHNDEVQCVVCSPNGNQVASSSDDGTVRLWDMESGACRYTFNGHSNRAQSIAYSPYGDQIASGSQDKTVRLWDIKTRTCSRTLNGHTDQVNCVVYSPDGGQIASGSRDKTVRLWDVEAGACQHTLKGHNDEVQSVVYSPKGDQIASGARDRTVRLWDVDKGASHQTLSGHKGWVNCVAYSPKGDLIVSSSADKTVRLWDAGTGGCQHILYGHEGSVNCVVYSPNGDQVASGGRDKTVRLWDVETGQCQMVIGDFKGMVSSVAWKFSSGQHYVVTGGRDRSVRKWQILKVEDGFKARLCWSSVHDVLTVTDTVIEGVRGLSRINMQLLKQRGAVGEPSESAREAKGKKNVPLTSGIK